MPISVTCRNCDESYTVRDENAGRAFKCKSCGESVTVPKRASGGSRSGDSRAGGSRAGGSRSEGDSRSAPPARRKKPTRKRARRPVEDDYEDYDAYDDDGYDDDSYDDYDEGPSRGGGRRGRGRASGRSQKRSRSGGKRLLLTGVLIVAVSTCIYSTGYAAILFRQLLLYLGGTSLNTFSFLHASEVWLRFVALAGMLVGYGICLAGPQKENSRGLNIAALTLGIVSFGLVLFLEIVPRFDYSFETTRRNLRTISGYFPGGDLWGTVFKQLLLEALHLGHFALFVLTLRCQVSRSHSLESSCGVVLFPLGAYGGVTIVKLLYTILYYRVIVAGAMKNLEQPLALWRWILHGFGWLTPIAFVVFLVLYLRVLFLSRSEI